MDSVAESGRKERSPRGSTRFNLSVKNERLSWDGTAKPVSRDQILSRERRRGKLFSWLIYTLLNVLTLNSILFSIVTKIQRVLGLRGIFRERSDLA